jgi:hypothetical protein
LSDNSSTDENPPLISYSSLSSASDSNDSSNGAKRKKDKKIKKKKKIKKEGVKFKEEKESPEYEQYEVTGVKGQERLAKETEEMCNAEMKTKNFEKSDGRNRAVLNFKKNGFPKLQNKTKSKASEITSN